MNSKRQNDIFYILVPSFVLILLWIVFTIYRSAISSTLTQTQVTLLKPLSPTFDITVIEQLKKRQRIEPNLSQEIVPEDTNDTTASGEASFTPPVPLASDSAQTQEGVTP
jgi:hypothetical protein